MNAVESPRRRWLTQERTVLLVVALAVAFGLGWLGWQAQIVRYRRAMRTQIQAAGSLVFMDDGADAILAEGVEWEYSRLMVQIRPAGPDPGISRLRRWLGDQQVESLFFNRQLTTADREAIEAFPEAEIHAIPTPSPAL